MWFEYKAPKHQSTILHGAVFPASIILHGVVSPEERGIICPFASTLTSAARREEALPTGYRGYSKFRTHTALGPYGRSIPRCIGPS